MRTLKAFAGFFPLPHARMLTTSTNSESGKYRKSLLRVATILGTTRTHDVPPVLGGRVGKWTVKCLEEHGAFQVDLIDPLKPEADLPLLQRPHFTYNYKPSEISDKLEKLENLSDRLKMADCYVFVTPEYNHMPSPAILNLLNHFGASTWAFKPAAVVSYSAGQWGGTRAAIALRTALLEIGSLPVSAMIHVANAGETFDAAGYVNNNNNNNKSKRWTTYAQRTLNQLEWWADAAKNHRQVVDPNSISGALRKRPSQRNAPR